MGCANEATDDEGTSKVRTHKYGASCSFATRDYFINYVHDKLHPNLVRWHDLVRHAGGRSCGTRVSGRSRPLSALVRGDHNWSPFQWQWLAMLTQMLWFPSHFWDRMEATYTSDIKVRTKRPTEILQGEDTCRQRSQRSQQSALASPAAFLVRKWIPKHEKGDIGKTVWLSQYWIMAP